MEILLLPDLRLPLSFFEDAPRAGPHRRAPDASSKHSPQESFLLTRINGSYDIQSILKITPMPQLDALLVFWKLAREGVIRVAAKK